MNDQAGNIRALRRRSGLSQSEFAARIGVHQTAVSQWETGRTAPDSATAKKIAKLFGTDIGYILGVSYVKEAVRIPVLGSVAAGIPMSAVEDILDFEEISAETAARGEYFALRIKGDSMEPKISDGDVVIVRSCSDCDSGKTVIALIGNGEATCKKLKKTSEGIFLISMNTAYEPIFFSNRDIHSLPVVILGAVEELRAKL
ncbi:LexA repressor [bioreactor metagenome]|uniref:LexA repressor n=1 Tax=bioreactor metagenome TaxID=1076179 RepID=A0A645C7E5_9ZZZZ|nr:XRE family transcriptional regulator [Oscillospiraceae bacterium]